MTTITAIYQIVTPMFVSGEKQKKQRYALFTGLNFYI